mmetsp:Transcript_28742/g.54478  ORF Transcript_28742/g.54478 Transcript_28742/m.54478 type:complete len:277 (+) Transcript_28742:2155-2985(+)
MDHCRPSFARRPCHPPQAQSVSHMAVPHRPETDPPVAQRLYFQDRPDDRAGFPSSRPTRRPGPRPSKHKASSFLLERAGQQTRHRPMYIHLVVDQISDRVTNWQVEPVFYRNTAQGSGCSYALDRRCRIKFRSCAKGKAQAVVAGFVRCAGQRQIAQPAQSHQRFRLGPKRGGDPLHFGKTTRHQRRPRAVAQACAHHRTTADGNHVFQCATHLGAHNIRTGIKPKCRGRKRALKHPRLVSRATGQRQRRRQSCCDIGGKAGPSQNSHMRGIRKDR